ncbi:hypothetical protein CHUAL_011131 [Chamberlinius hualienensis]
MEVNKCLFAALVLIFSSKLCLSNTVSTAVPTTSSLLAPGCDKLYPTMLKVFHHQRVTLTCPICTSDWTNSSYKWQIYNCQLKPPLTECWTDHSDGGLNYVFDMTVTSDVIIRCVANGVFKNEKQTGLSGPIYLDVDASFSLVEFCKSECKSAGVGVVIAIVTSVIILLVATAILLYFGCKKRILSCAKLMSKEDVSESNVDTQQEIYHSEDCDEDGYIMPIQHSPPDDSYIEIINCPQSAFTENASSSAAKARNRNDKPKIQPHLYENVQSLSLPTGGARVK